MRVSAGGDEAFGDTVGLTSRALRALRRGALSPCQIGKPSKGKWSHQPKRFWFLQISTTVTHKLHCQMNSAPHTQERKMEPSPISRRQVFKWQTLGQFPKQLAMKQKLLPKMKHTSELPRPPIHWPQYLWHTHLEFFASVFTT